ncbi:uncharacterized protein LOC130916513 isoform X2 [Corythoichthys intestinalis]|uniref:uncharacterized protein LOC130916513 isoform X2 n=1 Tax=Corythoichthys intestinalis TaxID=161448 RepID=UPI0025A62503|nr:uncharacterized protein LOC130916513 isoform X2 [Corythoichthys intestinalis]
MISWWKFEREVPQTSAEQVKRDEEGHLLGILAIVIHKMSHWHLSLHDWITHLWSIMHGLPCPSLGHCFGSTSDPNSDPAVEFDEHRNHKPDLVTAQPEPRLSQEQSQRTNGCLFPQETNGSNAPGNLQDDDNQICLHTCSDDDEKEDSSAKLELKYSHIPRPSIIVRQPKETASNRGDKEDGPLSGMENNTNTSSLLFCLRRR